MPVGTIEHLAKTYFHGNKRHLDKIGSSQSPLVTLLSRLAWQSVYFRMDDFDVDTINLDSYVLGADTGATTFAAAATQLATGVIQGATGTTDNEGFSIQGPIIVLGDNGCFVEFRLQWDAVTGFQMELGFINAATDATLPVVTDVDTPATGNGGTDVAVLHIDTDQTLTTMAFVTDGVTANMNATATTLSPTFTPTAATFHIYTIGIINNMAFAMVDGARLVSHGATTASQIEGGTLVRPWGYFRTRNVTSKTVDLDYLVLGCDRAARTN